MEVWQLRRGDTLLGTLRVNSVDQPWFIGTFGATPAFEKVRPLFDEELRLLEAERNAFEQDAWEAAYERIDALRLRLVLEEGGEEFDHFLLHIQGCDAWFRY